MAIPDGYVDALTDELAPYGLEFNSAGPQTDNEGGDRIIFTADLPTIVRLYPDHGLGETFRDDWEGRTIYLWITLDRHGEPEEIQFEVFDIMAWSASEAPALHNRLNTLDDPADHAVAVGEALGRLLRPADEPADDYFN